ncbi:tryptophan 2,3-dioxygenase [Rhodobacteraceae bacterium CCMM004]|nr:tryptophan 2,3-dioxygenase [Rhodobacteraceae bacterium CCMM004]
MTDAHTDFSRDMSYGDYLHLDAILTAQAPISAAPDEMLFIVQHQTSELWMRLAIHELTAARDAIAAGRLPEAFKLLSRVSRIMEQLNGAWDVLRTMTPSDYTTFRAALGRSSGFQSMQYRMIEFLLGNRNRAQVRPHAHRPDDAQALEAELRRPSLYQVALAHAAQSGFAVPADVLEPSDRPHARHDEVVEMWRQVYADPATHWPLYELAEKLVDLEDYFRRWRFNHVTTVERIIGFKRGTGGTEGVAYLKRMLAVELFPDLWSVRTVL